MNSPGLRERKKQKTRWAIQEHAVRLFAQQGYDATTVEQIAEAAEVSPSTFFRYFKTKEDVVVEDRYDPLLIAAIDSAPGGLTPLQLMGHALTSVFREMDEAELRQIWHRSRLIFSVPALRARSVDNMLTSIEVFTPPLARRMGRDPDDFAVRAFVGGCVGAMIAAIMTWARSDGNESLGKLTSGALDALNVLAREDPVLIGDPLPAESVNRGPLLR